MIDKHHIAHYAIAAVIAVGLVGAHEEKINQSFVPTTEVREVTHVRASRFDWPTLGEKKTIDLGESLSKIDPKKKHHVTLLCASSTCETFRTDLDDAFQIAWWESDFEDRPVDSEGDHGLFVGPPGPEADKIATMLHEATGVPVALVPISDIEGEVGIIIGKSEGK